MIVLQGARERAEVLQFSLNGHLSRDTNLYSIALEFPGIPHRYCDNHFLRDLAKPTLEADSRAKVQMRKKVRGLRDIERTVLKRHREKRTQVEAVPGVSKGSGGASEAAVGNGEATKVKAARADAASQPTARTQATKPSKPGDTKAAGQVVLDYCAAVRGILNDDQDGPLHPPGLRIGRGPLLSRPAGAADRR